MDESTSEPDPILSGLTPEQRRAVEQTDGPVIVVAGPGSGKTRVIARRVAYLVDRRGVPGWNVLAITFTNKAAEEMRHRIDALLGRGTGVTVSTFHSFCARTLRRYGPIDRTADFSIYDEDDQRACVRKAIAELKLEEKQWKPGSVLARISDAKNKRISAEAFDAHASAYPDRMVAKIYRRYEELLREYNALDFDDLLLAMLDVLEKREEVREDLRVRYRYVLVDEYQDTNRVQYEIANWLAGRGGNLCVVGDPDQSIYKWRGADIRNILDFEADQPGAVEVRLEQNFRSTGRILAAAQGLIRHNIERREKNIFTENDAGEAVQHVRCLSDSEEARLVARSIESRIREGDILPREIAVFYRTNALSRKFEEELGNRGIKHVVIGAVPFFARKEVKDVLSFVRLRANPQDDAALRRAIALAEGFGSKTLDRIGAFAAQAGIPVFSAIGRVEEIGDIHGRQRKSVQAFAVLVTEIFLLPEAPVGPMLRAIVDRTGVKDQLQKSDDPQDWGRADNIEQLVNGGFEFDERSEGKGFKDYLDQVALLAGAPEDKDAADSVKLMTLHSAKGLEFDEVYIAGVDGGLLPLERDLEECDMEEERRLFYVGLTRARKRVMLTSVQVRRTWGQEKLYTPSGFLKEIPKEALEKTSSAFAGDRDPPRPVDLYAGRAGAGPFGKRPPRDEDADGDAYEGDDDERPSTFARRARPAAPANPDAEEDLGDAPHADDDEIGAEPWSAFGPSTSRGLRPRSAQDERGGGGGLRPRSAQDERGGDGGLRARSAQDERGERGLPSRSSPERKPAPWERLPPGEGKPLPEPLRLKARATLADGERMKAAPASAPASTPAPGPAVTLGSRDALRDGERVEHPVFGRGNILRVEGSGPGRRVKVRFDTAGDRTLVLQYAKLTRVP